MTGPILVLGATGNLGGAAARSLLASGHAIRVGDTDPDRLRTRFRAAETVHLNLLRPETFPDAVAGAAGLFLIRPPAIAKVGPTLNALIDAARRADVKHVVFVSVTGADTNRVVPHHRVEQHLRAAAPDWTILRPGFFAQNLADAYREDIRRSNRIYVPAGGGRVAFVDTEDVGAAAAAVFADPAGHRGAGYTLTGPQAVTFDEVAALLTDALGRPIHYQPAGIPGYLRHLRRTHMPLAQCLVQTVLHAGLRSGQAARVDTTLGRLLGRPPRTLRHYIDDHRQTWIS